MKGFDWKGLLTLNQLRCRVLTNRLLGQCEFVPVPLLPFYKQVKEDAICSHLENDTNRENLCVSVKDFKYNKFRLLIVLPSNYIFSSECFTLDLQTGVYYACHRMQFLPKNRVLYGFVFSVLLNESLLRAFPQFDQMKVCDVFAGEGSVYDTESISTRSFFLKRIKQDRFSFQIMYPEICPYKSEPGFVRYELVNYLINNKNEIEALEEHVKNSTLVEE